MGKSYYVQLKICLGIELDFSIIYLREKKIFHMFMMFADTCEFNNISPLFR